VVGIIKSQSLVPVNWRDIEFRSQKNKIEQTIRQSYPEDIENLPGIGVGVVD
jgi:hypothetical protein